MTEYVSQAMKETAKGTAFLLYTQGADPYLEELIADADWVFYFNEGPRAKARIVSKAIPCTQKS